VIGIKTENPKGKGFKTAFPEKNKYHIPNYRAPCEYNPKLKFTLNNMRARCYNPKDPDYKLYGGRVDSRPIEICDEWRIPHIGLYNFIDWSYEEGGFYDQPKDTPYGDLLSIERKDPNGDYCPENCIWIPMKEQAKNTRKTIQLTYCGETHLAGEWSKILGIPERTILKRHRSGKPIYEILDPNTSLEKTYTFEDKLYTVKDLVKLSGLDSAAVKYRINHGWTLEEILLPKNAKTELSRYVEYNGITLSVTEWAKIVQIQRHVIFSRLRAGWSVEDALCTPPGTSNSWHRGKHNGKFITGWYVKDGHFYDENDFMRLVFKRR